MYIKESIGKITASSTNRPKLSIDAQIEYLYTKKGVKFDIISKEDAKSFLTHNNYLFKLKSYSKNYSINQNKYSKNYGKYENLDFAYLKELSTIDMYLRDKILKLALNIEHYLKLQLVNDVTSNTNVNGYDVISEFISKCKPDIVEKISQKSNNSYCKNLIAHRNGIYAVWDFIEIISFGDFIDLYDFYYNTYEPQKKLKVTINEIKPVQWLRNAAAHNNCLINDLNNKSEYNNFTCNRKIYRFISSTIPDISLKTLEKKMGTKITHDLVVMLYVFYYSVTSKSIKYYTLKEFRDLFCVRFIKHKDYFKSNMLIVTNYDFLIKVIDYFYDLCNNN